MKLLIILSFGLIVLAAFRVPVVRSRADGGNVGMTGMNARLADAIWTRVLDQALNITGILLNNLQGSINDTSRGSLVIVNATVGLANQTLADTASFLNETTRLAVHSSFEEFAMGVVEGLARVAMRGGANAATAIREITLVTLFAIGHGLLLTTTGTQSVLADVANILTNALVTIQEIARGNLTDSAS